MKRIAGLFVFGLLLSTAALAVDNAAKRFEGVWNWNKTESQHPENNDHPAPKSIVFTIQSLNAESVTATAALTMADGKTSSMTLNAKNDGQFYPLDGSTVHRQYKITQLTGDKLAFEFKDDQSTGTRDCTLSANGNKMSCLDTETDQGNKENYTMVFYRK